MTRSVQVSSMGFWHPFIVIPLGHSRVMLYCCCRAKGIPMAIECIFSLVLLPLGVFVFKALTNPNSDYGAVASGSIAGFALGVGLLLYITNFNLNYSTGYIVLAAIFAGAVIGASAGGLWTIYHDRRIVKGTLLGSAGGAVAAPIGLILLFPLMSIFFIK